MGRFAGGGAPAVANHAGGGSACSVVQLLLAATETLDADAFAKVADRTAGPRVVRKLVIVVAYVTTWLGLTVSGKGWRGGGQGDGPRSRRQRKEV